MRKMRIYAIFLMAIFVFGTVTVGAAPAPTPAEQTFYQQYETARLISLGAATCAGTYVPGGKALECRYLGEYGWKITPFTAKKDGVTANFMIATDEGGLAGHKLAVVAFRGSQTKEDWKVNFKTGQDIFAPEQVSNNRQQVLPAGEATKLPKVHHGFNQYVNAALGIALDLDGDGQPTNVAAELKKHPDFRLLITGHSLGGAAATLYAERLVEQGVPKEQIPVITFGAPAVGNSAFAQAYGEKINLCRVVTSYDPVPISLNGKLLGDYKQFGEELIFPLASTYTDFQHPISFYFDLAVKHYYDMVDKGVAAGFLQPLPREQLKGTEPLVAIAVGQMKNSPDLRFAPDIQRFATDEYKSLFPRYTVLATGADQKNSDLQQLKALAAKAGAAYLVYLNTDRQSIGQTDRWYVTFSQGVFAVPSGSLITMGTSGTRVTFNQGIMQSTIAVLEKARQDIKAKLDFTGEGMPRIKRFGEKAEGLGELHENH